MKCNAVFISDVHLGTRSSQAEHLLDFIKEIETKEIYLVGDIIDGWALKKRWLWPQAHSDVIQKILRASRKGVRVVYVLGNHDEFIRPFLPFALGDNIEIVNEITYVSKNKKRYLVIHGDLFDSITMTKKWLALLGDTGYRFLLRLNSPINITRKLFGYYRYWSFSKFIKEHVKHAVAYVTDFENILALHAKDTNHQGVICGHIHKEEMKTIMGVEYLNCGDWVESCSAIVETTKGEFKIIKWHEKDKI